MAKDPVTNGRMYFVDLCLPFGASISCVIFQEFSDAVKFITDYKLNLQLTYPPAITNYLDDFLFIAITLGLCNKAVEIFLEICQEIGCPVSMNKTEWATQFLIFLGILLNGRDLLLSIPIDKKTKAVNLLNWAIDKKESKGKVHATTYRCPQFPTESYHSRLRIHEGNVHKTKNQRQNRQFAKSTPSHLVE